MYGTIAKAKVRQKDWEELRRTAKRGPKPQGTGATMVFQMDADRNEIWMVAMAESEKAYRALSESPEMHEAYMERRQWFESEPEWHDGEVILFQQHPVPENAQLYGSIAEMCLKPGALEALMDRGEGEESPNGAVALCVFQMDADPNQVFMVAVSESEAAYRAYSESEESHQQYTEMTKSLEGEPKWHDGHVLEYEVFTN
jgi:heme-degrading monooxygenase HmoA